MNTTNDMVSPIIDIPASRMYYSSNRVNNQFSSSRPMESITSTNSSGAVVTGTFTTAGGNAAGQITSGGTGHTGATQTLSFLGTGYGAAGTATITAGVVTSITISSGGYGYNVPPKIVFPDGTGTAVCYITNYNSELFPTGGNALARYFTKRQQLSTVSSSVTMYVNAFSNVDSSFEVYIRTSLTASGADHSAQPWQLLNCDTTRNKSSVVGKFIEYKFYLDSITSFDLYSFKIVLRTNTPWQPPVIRDYRAIILA
jgi:hypothetical protein